MYEYKNETLILIWVYGKSQAWKSCGSHISNHMKHVQARYVQMKHVDHVQCMARKGEERVDEEWHQLEGLEHA